MILIVLREFNYLIILRLEANKNQTNRLCTHIVGRLLKELLGCPCPGSLTSWLPCMESSLIIESFLIANCDDW